MPRRWATAVRFPNALALARFARSSSAEERFESGMRLLVHGLERQLPEAG